MKKHGLLITATLCLIASTSFAANMGVLPSAIQPTQTIIPSPPSDTVYFNFQNAIDTGDGSAYTLRTSYFTSDNPSTACYRNRTLIPYNESTTSIFNGPDYSPDSTECSGNNSKIIVSVDGDQEKGKLVSSTLVIDTSSVPLKRMCNYIIKAKPVTGSEQYELYLLTDPACGTRVSSALTY